MVQSPWWKMADGYSALFCPCFTVENNKWLVNYYYFFFLKKKRKRKNEKKLEKLFATFTAKIEQEHPEASRGKWLAVRFFLFVEDALKRASIPGPAKDPATVARPPTSVPREDLIPYSEMVPRKLRGRRKHR